MVCPGCDDETKAVEVRGSLDDEVLKKLLDGDSDIGGGEWKSQNEVDNFQKVSGKTVIQSSLG